ncbi:hypothetical protein [Lacticaseibacillus paracasei]|uniref:hypothetical protein n=1 Tax=Lacticaseibacillus paracasei TaxID=1597 RepID=UPI003CFF48BF
MQFLIRDDSGIRVGQAIRPDRMELAASIHATNSYYCCDNVVYWVGNRHRIT